MGCVAVDHGPGGPPVTEEEVEYVELLAGVAGVALRNAQLYRERTALSLALAAERKRLSEVLEELPDGVVVLLGERGFANTRAREILGVEAEVGLGDLPATLAPALEGGARRCASGGGPTASGGAAWGRCGFWSCTRSPSGSGWSGPSGSRPPSPRPWWTWPRRPCRRPASGPWPRPSPAASRSSSGPRRPWWAWPRRSSGCFTPPGPWRVPFPGPTSWSGPWRRGSPSSWRPWRRGAALWRRPGG